MKSNFYIIITILFLCFCHISYGQNCVNDFTNGIPNNYAITGFEDSNNGNFYIPCGPNPSSLPGISGDNSVTFAVDVPEANLIQQLGIPIISDIGARALKLNPSEFQNSDRTTITTSSFIITDNVLSFDFFQIGMMPNGPFGHLDAYFQYRLLDANTLNVLDSRCFDITKTFNGCIYNSQTHPDNIGVDVVYTPNWITQQIDIGAINGVGIGSSVVLEFTVTDCGGSTEGDANNHFSTVYIDNICQISEIEDTYSISMDRFDSINCPTKEFTISGDYETPFCIDDEVTITVSMAPHIPEQNNIINAVPISTAHFTGFTYSFDIDPNTLNVVQSQSYDIFVIIENPIDNDNNIYTNFLAIGERRNAELTYNDCIDNPDLCEGTGLTITNQNEFLTCDELPNQYAPWFDIDVTINLPEGYTFNNLQDDYSNDFITMGIINLDNSNTLTTLDSEQITNWEYSELDNGLLHISYTLNHTLMLGAYNGDTEQYQGNFEFTVNANLTLSDGTSCPVSDTVFGISFDDCNEDVCENYSSVVVTSITPECTYQDTFNICGTVYMEEDTGMGVVMNLSFYDGNNLIHNYQIDRPEMTINPDGTQQADFCFEGDVSDFPAPTQPSYDFKIFYGIYSPLGRCRIESDIHNISKTGCRLKGKSRDIIKIYPNPAKNKVEISSKEDKIASIKVYDLYGNSAITIKNLDTFKQQLNVDKLRRGYYIISIMLNDGSIQRKNLILD